MGQDQTCTLPVAEGRVQILPRVASAGEADVRVVDVIGYAAVCERNEPSEADGVGESDLERDVVVAQHEDVPAVHPLGGSSEPQEETGSEMVDDPAVAVGDRMVELVDDDVVEAVRWDPFQNVGIGEGPYTCEEHVSLDIAGTGHQEPGGLPVMHLGECLCSVDQDLPAVGHEEYAAEGFGVLGGDERFPDAGGGDPNALSMPSERVRRRAFRAETCGPSGTMPQRCSGILRSGLLQSSRYSLRTSEVRGRECSEKRWSNSSWKDENDAGSTSRRRR